VKLIWHNSLHYSIDHVDVSLRKSEIGVTRTAVIAAAVCSISSFVVACALRMMTSVGALHSYVSQCYNM
jgi:hypothetical protein